ncbi:MAG: nucleotidyltransferase family protein [Pyrinomonadaceae bacterium]
MNQLPKKAVILARGLGTRMRESANGVDLTETQQSIAEAGIKALIPIGGSKTMLELILENLASAGFSKVCLVIGPEHESIREFCLSKGLAVEFAVQREAKGTADAVLAAEGSVGDELFLVVNSDNLYPVDGLRRLREANRPAMLAFDRDALIENSNIGAERIAKFATVEIDANGDLLHIHEKPEAINAASFVSMNAWLLPTEIFQACRAIEPSIRDEYELTAAVQYAIDELWIEFAALETFESVIDLSNQADIQTAARILNAGHH